MDVINIPVLGKIQENFCRGCGGSQFTTDHRRGEVFCAKCGLVQSNIIFDFGKEASIYDQKDYNEKTRSGGPVKSYKRETGLTTEIDRYDRDFRNRPIPPERKAKLYRLRKWQKRAQTSTSEGRNLSIALPELDRMCGLLNIPNNLKEEAARMYRKCRNKGVIRGRSIESAIAAVIYAVSRQHKVPKSLKELEETSGVKEKEIGKTHKKICRAMGCKIISPLPMDFVPTFANELGVSGRTEAKAIEIIETAVRKGDMSGKNPILTAAAAIYLANSVIRNHDLDVQKIAKTLAMNEISIRNRYSELEKALFFICHTIRIMVSFNN